MSTNMQAEATSRTAATKESILARLVSGHLKYIQEEINRLADMIGRESISSENPRNREETLESMARNLTVLKDQKRAYTDLRDSLAYGSIKLVPASLPAMVEDFLDRLSETALPYVLEPHTHLISSIQNTLKM